jgi:SAM-dependent methyltransferase
MFVMGKRNEPVGLGIGSPEMSTPLTPEPAASALGESVTADYARYLAARGSPLWKRLLGVQWPYRWNLRSLDPGYVLDVGCGVGRNLHHLDGQGVGVDPNVACVRLASAAGLKAFTEEEFLGSRYARVGGFDCLLISHVLEHLPAAQGVELVRRYLPYVRGGGQLILITPQHAGFRADPTHLTYLDLNQLRAVVESSGLEVTRAYSFPFPLWAGRWFPYNEFVITAEVVRSAESVVDK